MSDSNGTSPKRVRITKPKRVRRVRTNGLRINNGSRNPVPQASLNNLVRAGAGRPLGQPNKLPARIRNAIEEALNKHKGGAAGYFYGLSITNPEIFVSIVRRILPVNVRAEIDPQGLMARFMQTATAQRSVVIDGNATTLPTLPPRTPQK